MTTDMAIIDKRRPRANVLVMHIIGDVVTDCILADDMIDRRYIKQLKR